MMTWMMPLMFAWFTLGVPSGLAVYWAVSNIAAVIMYYFVYGPKNVSWRTFFPAPAPASAARRPPEAGGHAGGREGRGAGRARSRQDQQEVERWKT